MSETVHIPRERRWIGLSAAFALGAIVGGQAASILFLSSKLGAANEEPYKLTSSISPQPQTYAPRLEEAGSLSPIPPSIGEPSNSKQNPRDEGGDFFLGKEVDYLVPLGTPPLEARNILSEKLKLLPGLEVGEGENEILVIFDPLCPECHNLFSMLSDPSVANLNLKAKFIPANFFAYEKASRIASIYLLSMINDGKHDVALKYMSDLIAGVQPMMEPIDKIDPYVVENYDKGTMALLQTGSRVPFVVYREKNTKKLEFISGRPDLSDLQNVGML